MLNKLTCPWKMIRLFVQENDTYNKDIYRNSIFRYFDGKIVIFTAIIEKIRLTVVVVVEVGGGA